MATENGDAVADQPEIVAQEDTEIEQTVTAEQESENLDSGPVGDEDDRKLFVRGLNWNTKADALKVYIEKFGEVEKCEIKTHPNGQSRGFAFVVLKDAAALNEIVNTPKHELDTRTIEIKQANKKEKKAFVGGLSTEATDEQIRSHFDEFGSISLIELPMDANNKRRGFCFVHFDTEEGLNKATAKRSHTINGKECEVKKSQPKPRGGGRGGGDVGWRGGRGGFGRGGYGGYGGYAGGGYGYDYYGGGGYGPPPWAYDGYGGGYGAQPSHFGKQRGRGMGGFRPY